MNDNKDHYTSNYMVNFDDAIRLISTEIESTSSNALSLENRTLENSSSEIQSIKKQSVETLSVKTLPVETVPLNKCSGRISAEPISSPISVPTFDNSAMDGYAVNWQDLKEATAEKPIDLKLIGLSAAGDSISSANNSKGRAWKIMTGAPVPDGFDSIIPVENTKLDTDTNLVTCYCSPAKGAHIRSTGEDFKKGDSILAGKQIINANQIMALASLGIAELKVVSKPSIAVFSTGKELVDDATVELLPGQIRNSNMPYILDYLSRLPVAAFNAGTNYDDVEGYQTALQNELDKGTKIIISTGAVSMGDFDFIPQTILKLGGKIIFHKVKIRPGKPILFAKFPNGSYYFGLPGNPISANIGLRFFVMHCLRKMFNLSQEKPLKAKLNHAHNKKHSFVGIQKAYGFINEVGEHQVNILNGQESFKIQPLLNANGWAVLKEDDHDRETNSLIDFYPS